MSGIRLYDVFSILMKIYFIDNQNLDFFLKKKLKKCLHVMKNAVFLQSQTTRESGVEFGCSLKTWGQHKSETVAERQNRFESKVKNHSGALKQEIYKYNNNTMKSLILAQDER